MALMRNVKFLNDLSNRWEWSRKKNSKWFFYRLIYGLNVYVCATFDAKVDSFIALAHLVSLSLSLSIPVCVTIYDLITYMLH